MRCRAAEAGKKLKDHEKRRLYSSQMNVVSMLWNSALDLLRIEKHALRRVKISEILKEVHRRQNLRLFTVCVNLCVWFFVLRSICHAECSITGETLLGAGGIRKKFGPFEMKSINWAVVQRLPSVMPMSMHWALVLMSLRMQHLAGVVSWTRCPYRCLVTFSSLLFCLDMIDVTCNCWKVCVVYVCMNDIRVLQVVQVICFCRNLILSEPILDGILRPSWNPISRSCGDQSSFIGNWDPVHAHPFLHPIFAKTRGLRSVWKPGEAYWLFHACSQGLHLSAVDHLCQSPL